MAKQTSPGQPVHASVSEIDERHSIGVERRVTIGSLAIVTILMATDLIEDGFDGVAPSHLAVEALVIIVAVASIVYLVRRSLRKFRTTQLDLSKEVLTARDDALHWREKTAALLAGLGEAIDIQFSDWALTTAEKEVGVLMLKGLSHKEIAVVRDTSERTIRQQAAMIYKKAQLDSRAQLSAFFLEDLFLPIKKDLP